MIFCTSFVLFVEHIRVAKCNKILFLQQLAGLFTSLVVLIVLLLIGPLFYFLPKVRVKQGTFWIHVLFKGIININNNISLHPGSACLYKRDQPETDVSAVPGSSWPLENQQNRFCTFLPLLVPRKVLNIFNFLNDIEFSWFISILVMYVWADGVACDLAVSSCAKCWPGPGHWGGLLHDDSYLSHTKVSLGHYILILL